MTRSWTDIINEKAEAMRAELDAKPALEKALIREREQTDKAFFDRQTGSVDQLQKTRSQLFMERSAAMGKKELAMEMARLMKCMGEVDTILAKIDSTFLAREACASVLRREGVKNPIGLWLTVLKTG